MRSSVAVERVLGRLVNVTRTANGYRTSCPTDAHPRGDRSRGLYIGEGDDGRALLWCAAGCGAGEIAEALGLTVSDLFERPTEPLARHRRSRVPPAVMLELLSMEVTVVAIVAADFVSKRTITEEDWGRLALAVGRIQRARDDIGGKPT